MAEEGPVAGLQFFGAWQGSDAACLPMPQFAGRSLYLPGDTGSGWHGLAVTNTVNRDGSVMIDAVGHDGTLWSTRSLMLAPYEKGLLVAASAFPDLTPGSYVFRITSEDLLVTAVQLSGDSMRLSATAGVVVR